jgi:hypothetical protein
MGGMVNAMPQPLYLRKNPVPIVEEAEWASEPVGQVWKISAPPGFDPRTVQSLPSCYTYYTIPAPSTHMLQLCMSRSSNWSVSLMLT